MSARDIVMGKFSEFGTFHSSLTESDEGQNLTQAQILRSL